MLLEFPSQSWDLDKSHGAATTLSSHLWVFLPIVESRVKWLCIFAVLF